MFSTEDDLTTKLSEIVKANELLKKDLAQGANPSVFAETYDLLQLHCALYIDSQTSAAPSSLLVSRAYEIITGNAVEDSC